MPLVMFEYYIKIDTEKHYIDNSDKVKFSQTPVKDKEFDLVKK